MTPQYEKRLNRSPTSISKTFDKLSDCGSLLTDGHINTVQSGLLVRGLVELSLVDDCVNCNSGFPANQKVT